ncbi:hypothetical protein SPRG_12102 [Saprolegnia parasitica CBS 223.65]|uniref:Uncharacterized protein n=1 Tax=Saprolegnia parasitica (strain CBS 223.65) TaxID=695850 RepID=A0A067BUT8_SAPPC|nr:hypothetical protein SPRG_12102 [Saprolegnia parasitica CBS 223.65]KDO22264.1 hypothetical protein SPRG_12102 [Saprolegnia parasitica CBS 223.65]|eukprot:XP_012207000.1 hypothetical protein SPRG_12102 [Saprolegnia parasitica CBS 223.65]
MTNCSASELLPGSATCLTLTTQNDAFASSSTLTPATTSTSFMSFAQDAVSTKGAATALFERVDSIRGYTDSWFRNSLHAIAVYACDSMLSASDKQRCVARDDPSAVLNGTLCFRVGGDGNCFDQGLCERAANCYWPPPMVNRTPHYTEANVRAASAWVTSAYPKSFVPYAIPGVFLASLVLLVTVVFLILRCGCDRCYGNRPHRHGYTRAERSRPVLVYGFSATAVALCAAFAFTQNQIITKGINGAFSAVDMSLTNLQTMTRNVDKPLAHVATALNSTVAEIQLQLNPTATSAWMNDNITTLWTLRAHLEFSLAHLGPYPIGCTLNSTDVCVTCPPALCGTFPIAFNATVDAFNASHTTTEAVVNTLYSRLQLSQETIQAALDSADTYLTSVQAKAATTQASVHSAYSAFSAISVAQVVALMTAFAFGVAVCALGLVGIVAGHCSRKSCLVRVLNGAWLWGATVCIGGFAFSAAILIFAMLGNDTCHYVAVLRDNSTSVWPGQASEILHACFHNTSLLSALGIEEDLAFSCPLEQELIAANALPLTALVTAMTNLSQTLHAANESAWVTTPAADLVAEAAAHTPQLTLDNLPRPWEADGHASLQASGESTCYFESTTNAPRCYMSKSCNSVATACYTTYVAAYDTYLAEAQIRTALDQIDTDFSGGSGTHSPGWNASIPSVAEFATAYVGNLTQLRTSVLGPLQKGVVGTLLTHVNTTTCSMDCAWLDASYDLLYDSVCSNIVGALLTIALCLFLMCSFLLPVIVSAIVLEKRLRGLRKVPRSMMLDIYAIG